MNNGAFGEGFPYTNFHDLNMDWIIKIAKDFLDQYTNIQQTITEGLEGLDSKAQELEDLLQQWYDTHSEDIANQLASALEELNAWYAEHQEFLDAILVEKLAIFNQRADAKTAQSIASIPSDYSTLSAQVDELEKLKISVAYDKNEYYLLNTKSITARNTDFAFTFNTGDILRISCTRHGNTSNIVLSKNYPFSMTDEYISINDGTDDISNLIYVVPDDYRCLHIYNANDGSPTDILLSVSVIGIVPYLDNVHESIFGYEGTPLTIANNDVLAVNNTDYNVELHKGDMLKFSIDSNGTRTTVALSKNYPFSVNGEYITIYDSAEDVENKLFIIPDDYVCLHVYREGQITFNAQIVGLLNELRIMNDKFKARNIPVLTNATLTNRNTDYNVLFDKGDVIHIDATLNGNTANFVLSKNYPFSISGEYIAITGNVSTDLDDFTFVVPDDGFICLHIYNDQSNSSSITATVRVVRNEITPSKIAGLKYICFGDSITSDEVTGTGSKVAIIGGMENCGNFAHGNACCANWSLNGANVSPETLNIGVNSWSAENVLSNQILCALQSTTPQGEQIKWTHPISGEFSIPTSVGVGTGENEEPDIIYIAIGTNDGKNATGYDPSPTNVVDDVDTVELQSYSQLTKLTIASALRWTIETLRSAYPRASIFVATPLQTNTPLGQTQPQAFSYDGMKLKRDIIKKICEFCSIPVIDSFTESGFSQMIASTSGDGIHPNQTWSTNIASYVANSIENKYSNII